MNSGSVIHSDDIYQSSLLSEGEEWRIFHGDCIPRMHSMPESCVDFSIYSPPFPSLFSYSDSDADIGNVDAMGGEAAVHLSFMYHGINRILKPGRVAIVHVAQIPRMKRSGTVGLCDFRGTNIRLAERAGLVFEYDWMIRKNPQSQALRTRSRELQFAGLESDRAASRGTLQDYLLKFRKPGINNVPVRDWAQEYDDDGEPSGSRTVLYETQVSRNDWIKFAEGCWDDIYETDTLNTAAAKSEDDTRHICPLQLEVVRRCILLFSNPGEIVFSPFAGIGSEGYVALGGKSPKTGKYLHDPRRFYGCELKDEYYEQAKKNLASACANRASAKAMSLFDDDEG